VEIARIRLKKQFYYIADKAPLLGAFYC